MENFTFEYDSINLGTLTISHKQRTSIDIFEITDEKNKVLLELFIPFNTMPANAMKLIFEALDALDYVLE